MLNSLKHMWPDFLEIDFFKTIPKLDLPVYIFAGRSDYNTPFELAEQWAAVLEAPHGFSASEKRTRSAGAPLQGPCIA